MSIREMRIIRRRVVRDIRKTMHKMGLTFVDCNMVAAVDYVCMVNDIEFNGEYEYTGVDWVCDTRLTYPECFGLNY